MPKFLEYGLPVCNKTRVICYNVYTMKIKILLFIKAFLVAGVFVWFSLFLVRKIDLTTADLGRHIQNGKIFVHGSWSEKKALLTTNYYSYTMPAQPFINHHWLSGVLFYTVYNLSGFAGLSALYLVFGVLTLGIFFKLAAEKAGVFFTCFISVLLMPILSGRTEVRPEILTYFFTGVFFYILHKYNLGEYKKAVWVLPFLSFLWVNLHIGFVFGFLVLFAFFLESFFKWLILKRQEEKYKTRQFFLVGAGCVLASIINPHFAQGLLYPLNIFNNYGYLIVENQSVKFLENLGMAAGQNFFLFKLAAGLTGISFILSAIFARRFSLANFLLASAAGILAYSGIRHFPSFAFFALFCMSLNFAAFYKAIKKDSPGFSWQEAILVPSLVFLSFISIGSGLGALKSKGELLGFGLMPGVRASAEFFKKEHLKGPIFNDYDIGSYLALELPKEKVFVDNRPEAYSKDFFENVYKPMQADEKKWQEVSAEYNFNAIFFSHRDYTPWAQSFLISRVNDPLWAPVFADSYNIIFLKRTEQNKNIIDKFEIPKSNFGVR